MKHLIDPNCAYEGWGFSNIPKPLVRFKVGEVYSCRSICDYDCVFRFVVESRTKGTVTIRVPGALTAKRRKVRIWNGVEQIDPLGRYSMSPILSADKVALA
jgi:hypothetical protein